MAYAVGARLPGQTGSGNSQAAPSTTNATGAALAKKIDGLQTKVNASPDDYDLRLQLSQAYEENGDLQNALKQSDAAITIDATRPQGHANSARLIYLVSEAASDTSQKNQLIAQALAGFNQAITVGPDYPDPYYFRAVLYWQALRDNARAQADLQTYLVKAPDGTWADERATAARPGHDGARKSVDYRAPDVHDEEEEVTMAQPPAFEIDTDKVYRVTITTDRGQIIADLDPKLAPNTVNHFVALSRAGFYNGLTFHRVEPGFVIQGGDPDGRGTGGPGYKWDDEPVLGEYTLGAVAMANAGPNTNGSQFFITTADCTRNLTKSYNLFGYVTQGMDVALATQRGDKMQSVTVEEIDREGDA